MKGNTSARLNIGWRTVDADHFHQFQLISRKSCYLFVFPAFSDGVLSHTACHGFIVMKRLIRRNISHQLQSSLSFFVEDNLCSSSTV